MVERPSERDDGIERRYRGIFWWRSGRGRVQGVDIRLKDDDLLSAPLDRFRQGREDRIMRGNCVTKWSSLVYPRTPRTLPPPWHTANAAGALTREYALRVADDVFQEWKRVCGGGGGGGGGALEEDVDVEQDVADVLRDLGRLHVHERQ